MHDGGGWVEGSTKTYIIVCMYDTLQWALKFPYYYVHACTQSVLHTEVWLQAYLLWLLFRYFGSHIAIVIIQV